MDWRKVGVAVFVADGVILNLGLGYLLYKSEILNTKQKINSNTQNSNTYTFLEVDSKLTKLKQEILDEVLPAGQSATPIPAITQTPEPTRQVTQVKQASKIKTRTVAYVTVPGNGSSASLNWLDLPGTDFYFDKGDYPGLTEAYLEANINLLNGNGRAYVRLYDVTHGIGVQGSEVETTSQTSAIIQSGNLNFWAGKNLYRVQAKTLTADTAKFNYGRLRVVTEN